MVNSSGGILCFNDLFAGGAGSTTGAGSIIAPWQQPVFSLSMIPGRAENRGQVLQYPAALVQAG
jgi:hypothetical protein